MNGILKFVSGQSRVTPVGVAIALGAMLALGHRVPWAAPLYLALLAITLVASTFERVR
ncbi:MAG: hypothetical protein ABR508_00330 [Candidatus Baltobacteraceae bacterium]